MSLLDDLCVECEMKMSRSKGFPKPSPKLEVFRVHNSFELIHLGKHWR